jgi:hypothetical protein
MQLPKMEVYFFLMFKLMFMESGLLSVGIIKLARSNYEPHI